MPAPPTITSTLKTSHTCKGEKQDGLRNQGGHLHPCLGPPLNRGGGLRHLLSHTYDSIISATIRPPKPPPPSVPGSPTPTFNLDNTRPRGRPPGSRNCTQCLPLVDAVIAMAATPTTAPQATPPPPAATHRAGCPPCRRRQCRPTSGATLPVVIWLEIKVQI
jgi:hypothetical protein